MTGQVLSIILDLAVLIGLGFTIFFCLRLSRSMDNFRNHRQDMNTLIENLSKNIDEALRAIDGLKIAGDRSGRELQKIIKESRAMADELQIINESGNGLATRLEKLLEQGRVNGSAAFANGNYREAAPVRPAPSVERPAFSIQDREFDRAEDSPPAAADETPGVESQAEKELLEALRKNQKSPSRGVF